MDETGKNLAVRLCASTVSEGNDRRKGIQKDNLEVGQISKNKNKQKRSRSRRF